MHFSNLHHGYFAYENHAYKPQTLVLDSRAPAPDHMYGPAAWDGAHGPHSGLTLCVAQPTRQGYFDQVGEDDWKWVMPDGTELDEAPSSWPRRIDVMHGVADNPFLSLQGLEFPDEPSLLKALAGALQGQPERPLVLASAEGRLALAQAKHPHIFG